MRAVGRTGITDRLPRGCEPAGERHLGDGADARGLLSLRPVAEHDRHDEQGEESASTKRLTHGAARPGIGWAGWRGCCRLGTRPLRGLFCTRAEKLQGQSGTRGASAGCSGSPDRMVYDDGPLYSPCDMTRGRDCRDRILVPMSSTVYRRLGGLALAGSLVLSTGGASACRRKPAIPTASYREAVTAFHVSLAAMQTS